MRIVPVLISLALVLPKVISLGEIRIRGRIEKPMVTFVIPRARLDFLHEKGFLDKKNWIQELTNFVKSDIFQVR